MNTDHLYLRVWKNCLFTFNNWTPDRVEKWAEPMRHMFKDKDSSKTIMAESGGPLPWVIPLIVPDKLKALLSRKEWARLVREIESVLEGGTPYASLREDFNWQAAKDRLTEFLKRYNPT